MHAARDDDGPQTWHYGLIARWWAEFNVAQPDEMAYYRGAIERFGQPALDLACGTGRLLRPLLASGLDVDGVDLSEDMLALCREAATRDGLEPRLVRQAMHELDVPRVYRTIYICDSFGIGGRRTDDREALRRIHRHLEPGGALVFSHDLPYEDVSQWRYWLPETRSELPADWPARGTRRRTADGDELELVMRLAELDPLEQRVTMEMRPRLRRGDDLVAEELHAIRISLYFVQEVRLMLEEAGFADVSVEGRYSGRPATPDDTTVVFVART